MWRRMNWVEEGKEAGRGTPDPHPIIPSGRAGSYCPDLHCPVTWALQWPFWEQLKPPNHAQFSGLICLRTCCFSNPRKADPRGLPSECSGVGGGGGVGQLLLWGNERHGQGTALVKDWLVCLKTNLSADEASMSFLQNIPEDTLREMMVLHARHWKHKNEEARFCPKKLNSWG